MDWFPWCEEAFSLARESDRPVFLSVGYAACHWCHVMERESFENHDIAALLNEHFVSIKVDREERPDIDQIYMNAVQVMTGRGGWPMSVFLNHERQPFFAGTYWPPRQKFGMPGFAQVLDSISHAWRQRRNEVDQHGAQITVALQQLAGDGGEPVGASLPDQSTVLNAVDHLIQVLDGTHGGFGGAPKFPHATDLELLLRLGQTAGEAAWIDAVELTLDRMADGGIRDHIGGGFARYSVDQRWLVPHFEKMLYDNALLAEAYLHAYQVTGKSKYAVVASETFDYICREMVDPAGGFHCSEDADSEGVEGKFYVWTPDEISDALAPDRAERFCQIYDITVQGNFEGKSIPNLPVGIDTWTEQHGIATETLRTELAEDCRILRQARDTRIRPGKDDKVLTAWTSLAIKSLAMGGAVLDEPNYIDVARQAAQFLLSKMTQDDGRLLHAFRAGHSHLNGYLDDYAYTVEAFLALFEATGDADWIRHALDLADRMITHFEDPVHGGFFYTADDAETLIARTKDWHDGSLVSGNASAAMGLLKLSTLCDRHDYRSAVERTLKAAGEIMRTQSPACGALLAVLDRIWNDRGQLVLAVPDQETQQRMRSRFLREFRPHDTLSWVIGDPRQTSPPVSLNRDRIAVNDLPTVYRCIDFTCKTPLIGNDVETWLGQSCHGPVED